MSSELCEIQLVLPLPISKNPGPCAGVSVSAVPSAPGAASVRVWEIMSRDGGHEGGDRCQRVLMLATLDEPERVHAPPRAGRGRGQSSPDMGRQGRAESRAPAGFGSRARGGQDSGPSPTSALGRTSLPQVSLHRKRREPAPPVPYPEFRSFW